NYWFELHSQQTTHATPEGREVSSDWFSWNEDIRSDAPDVGMEPCMRNSEADWTTSEASGAVWPLVTDQQRSSTQKRLDAAITTRAIYESPTEDVANASSIIQNSTAADLSFPDLDLDYDELGGTLSWSDPVMTSEIEQYMVYLAGDEVGNDRALYANLSFGTTNLSVYTTSSLIEQTTPAELLLFDVNGTVDAPFFVGQDLNLDNLEGSLQWTPQASSAQPQNIQDYIIYLATSSSGDTRSQVGAAVPVGTNLLFGQKGVYVRQTEKLRINLLFAPVVIRSAETLKAAVCVIASHDMTLTCPDLPKSALT
ncbi:unnamed protein product, partial [Symbiodinium microadriaticum]